MAGTLLLVDLWSWTYSILSFDKTLPGLDVK